jgi:hypothetical protein
MSERRTIRELGGEIWAELEKRIPDHRADWRTRGSIVDVVMGVLAAHAGEMIENDVDLPVETLPPVD